MKRFLLLFIPILVLAVVCALSGEGLFDILNVKKDEGNAYFSTDLGFVVEDQRVNNFVEYKLGEKVVGECIFIEKDLEALNRIVEKLGLNISERYIVGETLMIEGVSPRLKYVNSSSKNNVQIAIRESDIVVASPIIYGSY